jgi:hypothetical protein
LREDILRGVRLFAIVFAAILFCVAAYRMLHPAAEAQSAPPAPSETAQPTPDAAPVAEAEPEMHPLVVPEPPPAPGTAVRTHVARSKQKDKEVPPPPPIGAPSRARRTPVPKEFEASDAVSAASDRIEESPDAKPPTPRPAVGYKSLIDAEPNRPSAEVAPSSDGPSQKPKGNRFLRAVGKIFHPGSKKETMPLTLQPKQTPP